MRAFQGQKNFAPRSSIGLDAEFTIIESTMHMFMFSIVCPVSTNYKAGMEARRGTGGM